MRTLHTDTASWTRGFSKIEQPGRAHHGSRAGTLFLLNPAARRLCTRGVERGRAFVYVLNLAVPINNERDAVGEPALREYAVFAGDLALEIAEERECEVQVLISPVFESRQVIYADAQNLCVHAFKIRDTTLVRGQFLRSTTGKRGRKEGKHDHLFAAIIRKLDLLTRGRR